MVNKKYWHVTLCVAFICFILLHFANFPVVAKNDDLNTMVEIIKQHDGNIKEWSLYAREEIPSIQSISQLEDLYTDLRQQFPEYDWKVMQKNDQWEAIGTSFAKNSPQKEKLQILSTLNKGSIQTYIVFVVEGTIWNDDVKTFIETKVPNKMEKIFAGKPIIFSCLKGEFSDTMESDFSKISESLAKVFQAKKVEEVKEEGFHSMTAVSPLFQNEIQINETKINVQIAIRSENGGVKTTFVIGTPIITIEY